MDCPSLLRRRHKALEYSTQLRSARRVCNCSYLACQEIFIHTTVYIHTYVGEWGRQAGRKDKEWMDGIRKAGI